MRKIFFTKNNRGYALIYTLLFIILIMITVSLTWFTGIAEINLGRRAEYSTEAYQLAQTAIETGYTIFKNGDANYTTPLDSRYQPDDKSLTGPWNSIATNACVVSGANGYRTWRIVLQSDGSVAFSPSYTRTSVNLAPYGAYDYRFCTGSAQSGVLGGTTVITGIGYYKGYKVTLAATVVHPADVGYCSPSNAGDNFPTCVAGPAARKTNHNADYVTISQVGPSS